MVIFAGGSCHLTFLLPPTPRVWLIYSFSALPLPFCPYKQAWPWHSASLPAWQPATWDRMEELLSHLWFRQAAHPTPRQKPLHSCHGSSTCFPPSLLSPIPLVEVVICLHTHTTSHCTTGKDFLWTGLRLPFPPYYYLCVNFLGWWRVWWVFRLSL